ncbi:MAG: DUF421 domain-containing protein [Actinomycetota bacterium]|nr:DUF421 domain-containing protein [Actinomycetota bacterium]MDQ3263725.1 DUF421 domain-containing protein [Myxococcota bacterium]
MFFESWQGLGRVLVVGVLAYVALVVLLRLSGNRTLSKLNAFDLVITVALGSTLATIMLSKDVALFEGVLAFALLVGLQFAVTWGAVRWKAFDKLLKSEPVLLVHRGRLVRGAMRRARVVEDEILAVLRRESVDEVEGALAVVLESDGSLSVLRAGQASPPDVPTLQNVRGAGEQGVGAPSPAR